MSATPAEMEELLAFVFNIANMKKDGELVDGEEFIMENDDNYDTLMELISDARSILGQPEDRERYDDA